MSSSLILGRVWASVNGRERILIHFYVNQEHSTTYLQLHQLLLHFPEVGTQFQRVIRDGANVLRLQCRFTRVDCIVHLSLVLLQLSKHGLDLKGWALETSLTYPHCNKLTWLICNCVSCRFVAIFSSSAVLFLCSVSSAVSSSLSACSSDFLASNSVDCSLIVSSCFVHWSRILVTWEMGNRTTLNGLLRIVDYYLQGLSSYWIIIIAMVLKRTHKLMQGRMWYCIYIC